MIKLINLGVAPCALFVLALFLPLSAFALEFSHVLRTVSMYGEIERGDVDRFLAEVAKLEEPPTIFHIADSPGGDLEEAMVLGNHIRLSNVPVWTDGDCFSACVFVVASGVERYLNDDTRIGLHRPYFSTKYFSGLSAVEAKNEYRRLREISSAYLVEMDVEHSVIERMFATDSSSVDIVMKPEADQILVAQPPFFNEWLASKCGRPSPEEAKILSSLGALRAFSAERKLVDAGVMKLTIERSAQWKLWVGEGAQAAELNQAGELDPYITMADELSKCTDEAPSEQRFQFWAFAKMYTAGKVDSPFSQSPLSQ